MSVLSEKALAYWILGETVIGPGNPATYTDEVAGLNNLSNNGNMAMAAGACGGNAAKFTALAPTSSLQRASTADLELADEDFELTGWFYTGNAAADGPLICKCAASPAPSDYEIFWTGSGTRQLTWRVRLADNSASVAVTFSLSLNIDTWYFVDVYHDSAANLIAIAVDNSAFETAAISGGVRSTSAAFGMGINPGDSTKFAGDTRMSNWGLWDELLSDSEREYLYGEVGPLFYPYAEMPDLLTGLVHYWDMEQATGATRLDTIGSKSLTDNNSVTQVAGRAGAGPYAAGFLAASSRYLNCTSASSLSIDKAGTDGFTVSFWAYPTVALERGGLVVKGDTGGSFWEWMIRTNNGDWYFQISNGVGGGALAAVPGHMTLNTWHYVCARYRSSDGLATLTVDCEYQGDQSVPGTPYVGSGDLYVGRWNEPPQRYSSTRIDCLGIWQRRLTDSEVAAQSACICPAEWPFDNFLETTIAFQAYAARLLSGTAYAYAAYGSKTYLIAYDPATGDEVRISAVMTDLNGTQPGDKVAIRIQRDGDDPNDPSVARCSLEIAALDYYTKVT